MHNKLITIHVLITGKVQGVCFRQSTLKKAQELKLSGWVKNNKDGAVELKASGLRDSVMSLTDWLWQGPPQAEVNNVQWQELPFQRRGRCAGAVSANERSDGLNDSSHLTQDVTRQMS